MPVLAQIPAPAPRGQPQPSSQRTRPSQFSTRTPSHTSSSSSSPVSDPLADLNTSLNVLSASATHLATLSSAFTVARSFTTLHLSCISEIAALATTLQLLCSALEPSPSTPAQEITTLLACLQRRLSLEDVKGASFQLSVLKSQLGRTERRDDRRKRWNMTTRLVWPMSGRQTELQIVALRHVHARVLAALEEGLSEPQVDTDVDADGDRGSILERIPSEVSLDAAATTAKEQYLGLTVEVRRLSLSGSEATSSAPASSSASFC